MAPTLYMTPASAPVRAVFLCAKALGINLVYEEMNLAKGDHLKPSYLKLNPQHTVPTLEDDDGFVVWDSHSIMAYLVGTYAMDESLYPTDLQKRAVVDQRLHFDTGVLYPRGAVISTGILFNEKKDVTDDEKKALEEAFDIVEKFLEKSPYVAGDELTIADYSFVTSITSWSIFVPVEAKRWPKITAWLKKIEALPYYKQANVPGNEAFKKLISNKLAE